jgi:hypothetical protein
VQKGAEAFQLEEIIFRAMALCGRAAKEGEVERANSWVEGVQIPAAISKSAGGRKLFNVLLRSSLLQQRALLCGITLVTK